VTDGQVPNTITIDLATTATSVADADKGDISITGGVWSVDANAVALTTDTTGNYVASVATTAPITGGAAGSEGATLTIALDQTANYDWTGVHIFDSDGVQIDDTDATHQLILTPGSNLTADRVLTITTGDAARTLTFTADATIGGTTSGTNTGDQTITLTGDVTGSGTSSFATTIADNSVDGTDIALGSDASGDVMYYNGTDWIRLAKGADGTVLKLSSGLPVWGTDATAGSPTWDTIGDAAGNGSISFGNTIQDITSTLDNGIVLELTDTDADAAADTTLLKLSHNDGSDPNVIYLLMQGDKDGTPTSDYIFTQSGFTSLLPINPPAETYGIGWNGDTGAAQKDNIYDILHVGDSDDDGKADVVDLGTAGIVRTTSGGVISSAELSGEVTTSASNVVTIADSVAVSTWNLTSPTISTPTMNGAAAWEDGTRQIFNPNGTNAGINVGSQAGDPSSPSNGDLWYDSTNNTLDARINGATVSLGAGGSGAPTDADYLVGTAN
jgi:hypothetical protein